MVITDGDLVTKLMSLPWEARAELLSLLGGSEAMRPGRAVEAFEDRDEDPRHHVSNGRR